MLPEENLVYERKEGNLIKRVYNAMNGFGLSLAKGGATGGKWELAVLRGVDKDGNGGQVCYDTTITGDVKRFANDKEASDFIVEALNSLESMSYRIEIEESTASIGQYDIEV